MNTNKNSGNQATNLWTILVTGTQGCGIFVLILIHIFGSVAAANSASYAGGFLFLTAAIWIYIAARQRKKYGSWKAGSVIPLLLGLVAIGEFSLMTVSRAMYQRGCLQRLEPQADFSNCNFSNQDLSGLDLQYTVLISANFQAANLDGTDLRNADLTGADLSGANISGTQMDGATLVGVNFTGALGLTDDLLAKVLSVPIASLPGEVTRRQIRLEDRELIARELFDVCSGKAISEAIPFVPSTSYHSIMVIDSDGLPAVSASDFPLETMAARFTELVACVGENEEFEAELCLYTGSRSARRYAYRRTVSIFEARTGNYVVDDVVHAPHEDCPEILGESKIYGSKVGSDEIKNYLLRLDFGTPFTIDLSDPDLYLENTDSAYRIYKRIHYLGGDAAGSGGNKTVEINISNQTEPEIARRVLVYEDAQAGQEDELVVIGDQAYRANATVGCQLIPASDIQQADSPGSTFPEASITLAGIAKRVQSNQSVIVHMTDGVMVTHERKFVADEYRVTPENIINPEAFATPLSGSVYIARDGGFIVRVQLHTTDNLVEDFAQDPAQGGTVDIEYSFLPVDNGSLDISMSAFCAYSLLDNRYPIMAGATNFINLSDPAYAKFHIQYDVEVSQQEVVNFYKAKLKELDWEIASSKDDFIHFTKDGKSITINIFGSEQSTMVVIIEQ
ncbi:MAG: pentapeptide repeat-containing protein [Chloroflexi bacterium]|nr:pentapeptide repeat-containing protein [Chloroflexota bacterium]